LLFDGSWQQTVINLDVKAPTSGLSMALFYSSGVVFAVTAALVLLYDLYRVLAGKLHEHELVMVQESEELAHVGEAHAPHGIANDTPRVVAAHGGKR
jgi:TRAP-type transport system small permease protein